MLIDVFGVYRTQHITEQPAGNFGTTVVGLLSLRIVLTNAT